MPSAVLSGVPLEAAGLAVEIQEAFSAHAGPKAEMHLASHCIEGFSFLEVGKCRGNMVLVDVPHLLAARIVRFMRLNVIYCAGDTVTVERSGDFFDIDDDHSAHTNCSL